MLNLLKLCLCLLCLTFIPATVLAEKQPRHNEISQPAVIDQLQELIDNIAKRKNELRQLDGRLATTKAAAEIAQLTVERQQQQTKLIEQINSLEQLATGAVDKSLFNQVLQDDFSWESEFKEIFKPILVELKQLTNQPRQIERLRVEKTSLGTRLKAADLAIQEIQTLQSAVEAADMKKTLAALQAQWQERREDLAADLQLVEFQLQGKINGSQNRGMDILIGLKDFFTGRGWNIILAGLGFIVSFVLMRFISNILERRLSRDKKIRVAARVFRFVLQIISIVLSTMILLAILYILGDWLLLALLLILLVGVLFALRNSVPRFINELRLLLNLGSIREGERVIYNGLPWKVSRLNIYSKLVNPLLTGGRIKLPLSEMMPLISRRWSREEPWFPCKPNEYVILDDNTYGYIALQSSEMVRIRIQGGTLKTYPVLDFLAENPRNLSEGFGVYVVFGLDYALQSIITSTVLTQIEKSLRQALSESDFGVYLTELRVEFSAAKESSLDILLLTVYSGAGAKYYLAIERFLQKASVDICNQQGWVIPCKQLTVHLHGKA